MNELLTRQAFLGGQARRFKKVDLLTGGTVRIRSLTNSEMRKLKSSLITRGGDLNRKRSDHLEGLLIACCLVDQEGSLMLTEHDVLSSDFGNMDGAVINHLFAECKDFTGFSVDDDFGAIEDEIKNSPATDGGSSSSDSD